MNEELQKAITELFQSAISAKDFLVGELPEYINQLLMWHAIYSGFWFLIGVLFCCAWAYANYIQVKWLTNGGYKKLTQDGSNPVLILNLLQAFIIFIPPIMMDLEWLQILVAPKVWLVEYAAKLIN